jgi:hypothetical protein
MYCRIFEPSKIIMDYGQEFEEIFFINRGSVKFYDSHGITPFL